MLVGSGWHTCGFYDVCFSCFLLSRQNNSQILSINGTINQLYLEVNISNTPTQGQPAEDAHNSLLNISIPTMFIFSGVRTKVLKVSLQKA